MGKITETYRKGLSNKESFLLSKLLKNNKSIFTSEHARKILKEEPYQVLHSLSRKNWILSLKGGLYAIVPLDIGINGARDFIVHDFVIASHLVKPYYISFWSALNYFGLSDQIPKSVFVATKKAKKTIQVLNTEFVFVQLKQNSFVGIEKIDIEGHKINISNINKTVADCLDHPEHSGGIEEVAKAIYFNHKDLNFVKIKDYALKLKNITILKRLGYILDQSNLLNEYKYIFDNILLTKGYSKLDTISQAKGRYNEKWKLLINIEIDPERWMY
ncbi:MAG: hypothetical protein KKD56_09205 [Acidobacteria bacterium]|nr:hypothetical protein [Acidobacteriota bacterium]MBU1473967.1 hypothetical protein [Acidobacteriota bacterium]